MGTWFTNYYGPDSEKRDEWIGWLKDRLYAGGDTSISFKEAGEDNEQTLNAYFIWDEVGGYRFGYWFLGKRYLCPNVFKPNQAWYEWLENLIAKLDELAHVAHFMWGNEDNQVDPSDDDNDNIPSEEDEEEEEKEDCLQEYAKKDTGLVDLGELLKKKLESMN